MTTIVRYGERTIICQDNDNGEEQMTVIDFFYNELKEDNLKFRNDTYQRMFEDTYTHLNNGGSSASRFLLSSPDLRISMIAAEMLNEKYQLSKMFTDDERIPKEESNIGMLLSHQILDYKNKVVESRLNNLKQLLRDKDVANNVQRYMDIMKEYMELKDAQKAIAQRLGDRPLAN